MVCRELFFFSLGFGVCFIGMSLVKKLFKRKKMKEPQFNESCVSATLKELSEDGLLDSLDRIACSPDDKTSDLTKSVSSSSANSDSSSNKEMRHTRRKLNATLRKYRKSEKKFQQKKNEVAQMQQEIDSLVQCIKTIDNSMGSLDEEINNKRMELLAMASTITPDMEAETRKKEVICYKRYTNIKTVADIQALFAMIKQRHEALKNLEILTLKKYWSIKHNLDKPIDNSLVLRSGIDSWFKQFRRNNLNKEPNLDNQTPSTDDDMVPTRDVVDVGANPASFVPLLESSI